MRIPGASMYYQQGDVILERVEDNPAPKGKPVRAENGSLVLERGEATGHAHRVAAEHGVNLFNAAGVLYLRNMMPASVTHEEHKPIELPPGTYRVRRVREYDHFAEETREVRD